jgi:hypothetical protein
MPRDSGATYVIPERHLSGISCDRYYPGEMVSYPAHPSLMGGMRGSSKILGGNGKNPGTTHIAPKKMASAMTLPWDRHRPLASHVVPELHA